MATEAVVVGATLGSVALAGLLGLLAASCVFRYTCCDFCEVRLTGNIHTVN